MKSGTDCAKVGTLLTLAVFGLISGFALPRSATNKGWVEARALNTPRYSHTATLLKNGTVLIAGGAVGSYCVCCCAPDESFSSSAELYDPALGSWSNTGSLNTARVNHTATLLHDGRVLVTGGYADGAGKSPLQSAEMYDPATGHWSYTAGFNTIQGNHSTTLLESGKVLAVGRSNNRRYGAELYDPAMETWRNTDSPNLIAVSIVSTILLSNGKVLTVAGNSAELFDPATELWSSAGDPRVPSSAFQRMTLLRNGEVLVTGSGNFSPGAEIYDPNKREWRITGSMELRRPGEYTATRLHDGRVLVAGGYSSWYDTRREEVYDPATGRWSETSGMIGARHYSTATLLQDGKVLVAGGVDEGPDQPTFPQGFAEIYNPDTLPIFDPIITSAAVSGKNLIVIGENFDSGAVILLNGEEQITKQSAENPQTTLIGKKAGKKIKPGDRVQVRNLNGSLSAEFIFTSS